MRKVTWRFVMERDGGMMKFPSSWTPATIRRFLLLGVPSLAFLGIVGIAGWKWYRNRTGSNDDLDARKTKCQQPALSTSGDPVLKQPPPKPKLADNSSSTPLESDTRRDGGGRGGGVRMTSSNVRLPTGPLGIESELPLRPISRHHQGSTSAEIHSNELEDSTSSSEGLLSLPSKSPHYNNSSAAGDVAPPSLLRNNLVQAPQLETDSKSAFSSINNSSYVAGLPVQSVTPLQKWRKDRMRIMIHIPRDVVGRFIGKQGRNIKSLMVDSGGAHVYINQKNLPREAEIVSCAVQGTFKQVEEALKVIRMKYPEIETPNLMGSGNPILQSPIPSPLFGTPNCNGESWEIELLPPLIPTSSFNAMVCYIENLSYVWLVSCEKSVQLDDQHQSMSYTYCYATTTGNDLVQAKEKDEYLLGKFCAVRVSEIHWLRGRITQYGDDATNYEVQLMDYGSTVIVPPTAIKPLRREHCQLPIQAFKSKMAHVEPKDAISETGLVTLQKMVEGIVLEVHIAGASDKKEESVTPSPENTNLNDNLSSPQEDSGNLDNEKEKDSLVDNNREIKTEEVENPKALPTTEPVSSVIEEMAPSSTDDVSPVMATKPSLSEESITIHTRLTKAPLHVPSVELYAQVGAQSPTFINRELIELGYATWKEDSDTP